MGRIRFSSKMYHVSLDPESLTMLKEIARAKTNGNGAEAVRLSVRKFWEGMKAENRKLQEPEKSPETAAIQASLPLGDPK
jgi:hypothetical protein